MPIDPQSNGNTMKVVLVTGPSGAGRSTAIHTLEDIGFEAIDNLPISLLPRLLSGPPVERHLALGMDARNRDFSAETLIEVVDIMSRDSGFECTLLYLDCAEDVLVRRYSETRRRHPLAPDETPLQGIRRESDLLGGLKQRADILINTSDMPPNELRREISNWFQGGLSAHLALSVQSFSYKRGIPRSADMVLDCRFLANPHWQPELRNMNGLNAPVRDFVTADARYDDFFKRTHELVTSLIPAYREEGKSHFTLALGCTGGQHRSVSVAEELANALAQNGWQVSIRHRELERRAEPAP